MAEPLKNQFGPEIPQAIAQMLQQVHAEFPVQAFLRTALQGYEALELMDRGRHIARALHAHLPPAYPRAVGLLLRSMDQAPGLPREGSLASFLFLPHSCFVAEFGLDHVEPSMRALHAITQRFTSEFAIRPFLVRHPQATLQQLAAWAQDPSDHVRRLVSEGTRPRLPWAPRLPAFQADPQPVLALLERLRDDPSLYVRRSVANNLNDIGKDHPDVLAATARRWLADAPPERAWVVRHALRWAVKQGAPWALDVLGYGQQAQVAVRAVQVRPARPRIGGTVVLAFEVHNTGKAAQDLLVDLRVHYASARGAARAKVFKLGTAQLAPGAALELHKTLSLRQMTTRQHHAGRHRFEVLVNGAAHPAGHFDLRDAAPD